MTDLAATIVIVIVGFRNPGDIVRCLQALADAQDEPAFEIFIAENGGPAAMDSLVDALGSPDSRCRPVSEPDLPVQPCTMLRRCSFRLVGTDEALRYRVNVAQMPENLGYAGAVNTWLRPLLQTPGWEGVWILNPDTEPTSSALAELVAYSKRNRKGMVGGCMLGTAYPDRVHSRGLAWRKLRANTLAVDYHAPITPAPDPEDVEARLDAPSGASCYVTRELIGRIGLMDERYFLYFEDLEWGCRAKRHGDIGYAHRAVVPHAGGTTIGATYARASMSPLSVYLEFRNRIIFVRSTYPAWLHWTILMQIVHALAFGAVGAFKNMSVAFKGLWAGILGEVGRPDRMLTANLPEDRRSTSIKKRLKILVSCVYCLVTNSRRALGSAIGYRVSRPMVVLYYHSVPGIKRRDFARQMALLAQRAHVVPADWHREASSERPVVAITFDDAFVSVAENALPELAGRGFPCTIFVPSGVMGRSPDWAMEGDADRTEIVVDAARLKELHGPLVAIGAHSVSHPHLTCIPPASARAEIAASRSAIASLIGMPVTLFAFPYGDHDAGLVDFCRQEGFKHAFTIVPDTVDAGAAAFLRGRVSVDPADGNLEFLLKMSGSYAWLPFASALKRRLLSLRHGTS